MTGGGLAWVIGRSGLLGSHLTAALQRRGVARWEPPRFAWNDEAARNDQLDAAVDGFRAAAAGHARWAILWSAGAGVVGTPAESLAAEARAFARLLARLEPLPAAPGAIFLASSAGGVHGGATARPIDERDPPRPISAYGAHKLALEETLAAWAAPRGVRHLIARLTNLYGPGQDLAKAQGFISQLCRSVLRDVPLHVYVPLATIRDFLFAGDAADDIVALLAALPPGGTRKILAAGHPTTLAMAARCVGTVARRQPRLVCAIDPRRAQQPLNLSFRSVALPDVALAPRTALLIGAAWVYHDQLRLLRAGRLSAQ